MQLCSLSMTNASPYHSSPVAIGHFHNLDISKALTHATPFSLSAIFPAKTKLRFIRVGNTSPKCCQMRTFAHSSWFRSGPGWGRQAWRWASLRRFLTVCAEVLWFYRPSVAAAGPRPCLRWRCWCAEHSTTVLQQFWWTFLQSAWQWPSQLATLLVISVYKCTYLY